MRHVTSRYSLLLSRYSLLLRGFFKIIMNPESKEEKSQNSKDFGDNNESSDNCHMIYSPQTREMKLCGKFTEIDSNDTNFSARKCPLF